MTSLATRPRCGRRRAARPCAVAAAAAPRRRSSPLARNAARIPVRTSPVPAVASPGASASATSTPCAGRGDDRVRALEQADAAEPLGAAPRGLEPVRVHPAGALAEQPPELARVRRQHGPCAPLPRLELVQSVGVEHERLVARGEQLVAERLRGGVAAEARARSRARRPSQPRRAASAQVSFTGSSSFASTTGSDCSGDGDGDVAGIGAEGGLGGEAGGAGHPGRAAGDEHRPGAVLAVLRPLARHEREDRRRHEPVLGLRGLEPDVRDHDLTGVEETRRDREPELAAVEGHGHASRRPQRRRPRPWTHRRPTGRRRRRPAHRRR